MEGKNKFRFITISVLFVLIISFPLINSRILLIKDVASTENRQLSLKPDFDITSLDAYPENYEKYYNDNFSMRNILTKYYNILCVEALKKSPYPDKVVIGKEGWLFPSGNQIESYKGINRLTTKELEAFRLELEFRKKYLNQRGCKFYFVIAPDKTNIYSDKIPNTIFRYNKQSWGEQLIEYLYKYSDFKPINIYETLRANKNKELLYYKLDHHWNPVGAYYASNVVLNWIHNDFSDVSINSLNEYNITKSKTKTGNLINMLGYTGQYYDYEFKLSPKYGFKAVSVPNAGYKVIEGFAYPWEYEHCKEIIGSNKPKILIIADSYGDLLFPILAEQFSRTVKIFDSWQYRLNEDVVNGEKPDVVLLIALESNMKALLNNQARLNNK